MILVTEPHSNQSGELGTGSYWKLLAATGSFS